MAWKERFDRLDEELEALFQEMDQCTKAQLNRKPGPEKWSALQTLEHVYLAEYTTHRYLIKKLSYNPTLKKANLMTAFRRIAVVAIVWVPIPYQAPKPVASDKLPPETEYSEIKDRFRKHRKEFRKFVLETPEDILNAQLYRHILAGRMDAKGMMLFIRGHFRRHRKQIRRALPYPKQSPLQW